jgi:ketosteroid isomerase-like protein
MEWQMDKSGRPADSRVPPHALAVWTNKPEHHWRLSSAQSGEHQGSANRVAKRSPAMLKHHLLACLALLLAGASAASAQNLTETQARAIIAPWYGLFNVATRGDVKSIQEQVLTADYESCAGYLPGECWGRDNSIKVVANFSNSIPDMKFEIKEVLVVGDRVIVRGEVTGTPAGELFGVPHNGKSFRMMAIDIQTIRDGKISKTYHLENWLSALGQLRAK